MTKGSSSGKGLGLSMTQQGLELTPFGSLASVKSFQNSQTLGHFFEPLNIVNIQNAVIMHMITVYKSKSKYMYTL